MSSQLQVKMGEEWMDIEADDYPAWIARGYAVRALKLVVVGPREPDPEELRYQYRWINKNPIGPWNEHSKDSYDLCVEQLNNNTRADIQVRVMKLVQVGDIIGPPVPEPKEVEKAV